MADIINFSDRSKVSPEVEAGLNKPKKTEDIEVLDVIRLLILTLRDDPDEALALMCWEVIWDALNPYAEDGPGPQPVEVPPELKSAVGKMNRAVFFEWLESQG